ncbi:TrmH family RNA methyltransferase [Caproiciproducens sp. CPB-2]|uniref:TrmH family RNA methyltransferase n=1 Tax=Caproiciproducens sp. CPB-2 TaxID=3030017 RepID=UPI0023DA196A|nr:RNA methyltransferase [Caproiciproducens sp. CPB-2]MDF1495936.1 RNA methyltransferase [Caproiciproducens sp. CPB-2]
MPDLITSRQNEIIKHAARLSSTAGFRREEGLFLAEGARLCRDAAQSGVGIRTLFYTAQAGERYADYLGEIQPAAEESYLVEPHVAALLSDTKSPQGIFCVCRMRAGTEKLEAMEPGLHYLGLENIQNPANLGAVLRTAEALGIGGVLLGGSCCDVYSPKVLRASMGAVFRLPFYVGAELASAIGFLNGRGFVTLAAVPDSSAQKVTEVGFRKPTVLFVGNEGNGLTSAAVAACSGSVTIPMLGRAESLNASASAAILMWEMMREKSGGV